MFFNFGVTAGELGRCAFPYPGYVNHYFPCGRVNSQWGFLGGCEPYEFECLFAWSLCPCYGRIRKDSRWRSVSLCIFQHIFQPLSIFPLPIFFLSSSLSLTLGHNELCSLGVIGSQMCCRRCQCNGLVCDGNTQKLTHRGHCQLIKTVTMHKCLCCPIPLSSLLPTTALFLCALSLPLSSPTLPRRHLLWNCTVPGLMSCEGTLSCVINKSPQICYWANE